ncbi:multifunctional CCA tRNA nucleotidyl transferase/2'3'-cyclic phosphodiesterase/2'nucleotidase/phosphatase [Niveibacterium sp. 24ML]|uniref:multifunctional CCA tRNA nucleotidyl transferase/2'3'-cyclic phosphodiesterase/2'nucleotidase/phosphatase n=1 Tax=Niveibacterium sp. 24ML TaxID=2985512 RepID=UPI00226ED007|nr:multifunctional CCA tRNA nucleotidyl transferase/2'3'-cyclic phosphodiesterase/2'nucleotidase/phosphatase [Niveibacterium sp. 24ML]MCX9157510.1 multifunctional CCA tRNA nucleotidyl transferase/2'3'-cyclic phosphodiesterase/2'nucleotidase/phosphatase [Niveibacterium sp. 24ML]
MKAYVVGGAVRDALLGLPIADRDWVVVGASPEAMIAKGFKPVGRDFPVFLHPQSHEEYALARTERKTGPGYHGFSVHAAPDVSLEQDLQRRDLTINAMARDEATGQLFDPWGGQRDLAAKVLRHVSPAFSEDPVRILRLARFAARFADFSVADETMTLMRQMVDAGEVDHLVPERVWQEVSRGLMSAHPSRMFEVLSQCGALARLAPAMQSAWARAGKLIAHRLDHAGTLPLEGRFALLAAALDSVASVEAICIDLRVPTECRELAELLWSEQQLFEKTAALDAPTLIALFDRCDAWRRGSRFAELLASAAHLVPRVPLDRIVKALERARAVDAGAVAKLCMDKSEIPRRVRDARVVAVAKGLI